MEGVELATGNELGTPTTADGEGTPTELVNFFEGKLRDAIEGLSLELRFLPEDELCERARPTVNDYRLRQNFADVVKRARIEEKDHITTTSVYDGVFTRQAFFQQILPDPLKVAWMIRPPIDHTDYYAAIHKIALQKLVKILDTLPNDSKYIPQILKLAETAANRVHGPVVQRMQIQSKNVNIEVPGNAQGNALPAGDDPAQIQSQIDQLQQKLLTRAKDVTPEDAS